MEARLDARIDCVVKKLDAAAAQGEATAAKLDALAADLAAHRTDTEAHHRPPPIQNAKMQDLTPAFLTALKECLNELLGDRIVKMVLYGSRARGDYDSESDIDVAIIVRGLTRDLKNRILDSIAAIEIEHLTPVSTLVLSEDDFEALKKRERRIVIDIEKEGIPL